MVGRTMRMKLDCVEDGKKMGMTPKEFFGSRLKAIRKEKKVSQADLAKAVGVHAGTISHWESGKQMPESGMIQKIADNLGVSINYLMGEKNNDCPCSMEHPEREMEELVSKLKALSRSSLQIVGATIRAAYSKDEAKGKMEDIQI